MAGAEVEVTCSALETGGLQTHSRDSYIAPFFFVEGHLRQSPGLPQQHLPCPPAVSAVPQGSTGAAGVGGRDKAGTTHVPWATAPSKQRLK